MDTDLQTTSPNLAKGTHSGIHALIWLVPVALLGLVGYVTLAALKAEHRAAPTAPVVGTAAAYPMTITESDGRKVVIAARPARIVPCNAGLADILSALVTPGRLIALPATADGYGGATEFYAAHKEIQRFEKFQAETILALKPDLVVASSFQEAATIDVLQGQGVPVLRCESYTTFTGIRASMEALGHILGEEKKGKALTESFDRRLAAIEKALAGRAKVRCLAYSNFGQGFVIGSGESQDEVMRGAGAINAASELNLTGHVHFSFEQILKLRPDCIIVTGDKGMESPQVAVLLNEPSLSELPAIKQRRIAVVPDRYYTSIAQYVVDGVEILARQLHPDAFQK
ncbi:MAG TPA: ABC transporter substrate-binding protein [Planctomycetota bacterium]|jgi:iron complex transport system substrate-binding protein